MTRLGNRKPLLAITLLCLVLGACASNSRQQFDAADPTKDRLKTEFSAESLMNVAERLRRSGDPGNALAFYRRAQREAPADFRVYTGIGQTLIDLNLPDDALRSLEHAAKLNPEDEETRALLARMLLRLGRAEAARGHYNWLLEKDAKNPAYYNGLGIAFDILGKHSDAQSTYSLGLHFMPEHRGLRNNLALSMAFSGEYDAALALLEDYGAGADQSPEGRQNLALVHGLAGHREEAARLARIDLNEKAVKSNLEFYSHLRHLSSAEQAAAILLGEPVRSERSARLGG